MAVVKSDSKEMRLSNETMLESPLKLVDLRQRTNATPVSPGLHFRAPSKAAYTSNSSPENTDAASSGGTKRGKTPAQAETASECAMLQCKEFSPPKKDSWNNSSKNAPFSMPTTVAAVDDSQHSSTSEYGSMADTYSSVSDSRLSSPQLVRSVSKTPVDWQHQRIEKERSISTSSQQYHHEKSPSWPDMYFDPAKSTAYYHRTQSCWNSVSAMPLLSVDEGAVNAMEGPSTDQAVVAAGGSSSTARHSSSLSSSVIVGACGGVPSSVIGYGRGESSESENAETGAGESSTLRRCSAQSMREICPQLLKKLQQPPTHSLQHQQQHQHSRASVRVEASDKARYYSRREAVVRPSNGGGVEIEGFAQSSPRMHSKSTISTFGPTILASNENSGCAATSTPRNAHRSYQGNDFYEQDENEHSVRRSASSENVVRNYAMERIASSNFHSTTTIGADVRSTHDEEHRDDSFSTRRFDEEIDDWCATEKPKTENQYPKSSMFAFRGRYQQKQHKMSPISKSSIRRKLQHSASMDVAPARSLPDLSGNVSTSNFVNEEMISNAQKQSLQDSLAYATSQYLSSASFSATTSPLYAVPHKLNSRGQQQSMMTKASPPPPPLPRKPPPFSPSTTSDDRVNHFRGASDGGLPATTTCNEPPERASSSMAMMSRKFFMDQIQATNSTDPFMGKQFPNSGNAMAVPVQTTFPASNANRRIVQVHPMCVNSVVDDRQEISYQGQTSPSLSSSSGSSSSSSNGQYSPPCLHSDILQNAERITPTSKPRPPVPKKPPKLSSNSTSQPVPTRPPKPASRESKKLNLDRGHDAEKSIDQKEIGYSTSFSQANSNGSSPFKQRKQLEDEEKCRELSSYVAQKSKDSTLKQILAPNQRCSVDYLEEYFANLTPLENGLGDGRSDSESSSKQGFFQNGSGRSHAFRATSMESIDLEKEKIDLIARMSRKLKVLKEEQRAVEEEIGSNNELGASLFALIDDTAGLTKQAKDRFRQFVVDTENSTQLLLKLSCQLARMDNELNRLPHGNDKMVKEKQLMERRRRLMSQLQDAKELREDLDRRSEQITTMLRSILSQEQLADYQYFIQMKHKLLLDGREIEDKIKLGEDQKHALELSLSKA